MSASVKAGIVTGLTPPTEGPLAQHRFGLADLDEMGHWLVTRLRERYIETSPGMILGFLRGCMTSNEWWFERRGKAVGLAQLLRLPLEPQPIAAEFFLLHQPDGEEDAFALYPAMASWAAHQNASRLVVERHSDIRTSMVCKALTGSTDFASCGVKAHKDRYLPLGRIM